MNAKMSQHLTLLGLCAMIFYGAMLATGTLSFEVMPQFVVSALMFLTSGRLLHHSAKVRSDEEEKEAQVPRTASGTDWPWLTALLNWSAALLILAVFAIIILKPAGVSFAEALRCSRAPEGFFSSAIP